MTSASCSMDPDSRKSDIIGRRSNRMFSLESKVDMQNIRSGDLSDTEWEQLIESAG